MAGFLHNDVFDSGLSVLDTATATLYICSQQPATLAEANSTYALGNKSGITIGAPADRSGGGREVTVSAITGGIVTGAGTQTATHWAIVDATRLLATNAISPTQSVTNGNTFSLASFTIGIPDPA